MYIVGKKVDESIVEKSGTYSNGDPSDAIILNNIKNRTSGTDSDYSVIHLIDSSSEVIRIEQGDSFSLVWESFTVTPQEGEPYTDKRISGVSFAIQESKLWLRYATNKTNIMANGEDAFILEIDILKADKSEVETTFSETLDLPIQTPNGLNKARFYFTSGKASKQFKSSIAGEYRTLIRHSTYRIDNSVTIEVIL